MAKVIRDPTTDTFNVDFTPRELRVLHRYANAPPTPGTVASKVSDILSTFIENYASDLAVIDNATRVAKFNAATLQQLDAIDAILTQVV